jgi:hypothetical protein
MPIFYPPLVHVVRQKTLQMLGSGAGARLELGRRTPICSELWRPFFGSAWGIAISDEGMAWSLPVAAFSGREGGVERLPTGWRCRAPADPVGNQAEL